MTPMPLHTLGPDDDIARAVRVMEETEVRRIPIVTADGVLVGVIRDLDLRNALRAREYDSRQATAHSRQPTLREALSEGAPHLASHTRVSPILLEQNG
jgi:predicted transcriptional regulator